MAEDDTAEDDTAGRQAGEATISEGEPGAGALAVAWCRVFGHRPVFRAEGPTMRWECARACGGGAGAKDYDSAEQARRFADAFNRRDADELGNRAPLIGLLPLRLWRRFVRRRGRP